MKVELKGSLGEFQYDEATKACIDEFINRALPLTQAYIRKEIHHISHETERHVDIEKLSFKEGKIYVPGTSVPYNKKLEFRDSPFMRPGARKAKRKFNKLAKEIFGETYRAWTRMKGKRTRFVKGLVGKLKDVT